MGVLGQRRRERSGWAGRGIPGALALLLCVWLAEPVARGQLAEADVKAAFLYHFTRFVEWPPEAFATTNSPIYIGVLGSNPFGRKLESLAAGEEAGGRPIQVKHYPSAAAARQAHILFISESEREEWGAIRQVLGERPILTVSDIPDFAERGGMIGFYMQENRVRLRIHHQNARERGLVLSSKLLRVAEVIGPK